MDFSPTYDPDEIPWQLIVASFQGRLEAEEKAQLDEWLSLSPANQEKYAQWQQLWRQGLTNYEWYRQANAPAALHSLRERIGREEAKIIRPFFGKRRMRWMAAAAVILLALGAGWWYFTTPAATLYETAEKEQKTITLPDGSSVSLQPQTAIRVAGNYNKSERTITLSRGEAFFEVKHQAQLPFIVNLGITSVKDIGTSFTIQKKEDSIKVTVRTGKVAFVKNSTGEQHELSGGMALSFHNREESFGEIALAGPAIDAGGQDSTFRDIPLGDIIANMENKYGKKILLTDSSIGKKKLTIRLAGQSFDDALRTICISLNLTYSEKAGIYVLKNKYH